MASDGCHLADSAHLWEPLDLDDLRLMAALAASSGDDDGRIVRAFARELDVDLKQMQRVRRRFRARQAASGPPDVEPWTAPAPTTRAADADDPHALDHTRVLAVPVPLLFGLTANGFEHVAHSGQVDLCLDADGFSALRHLAAPITRSDLSTLMASSPETTDAHTLLERLLATGLLRSFEPDNPRLDLIYHHEALREKNALETTVSIRRALAAEQAARPVRAGAVPVHPVHFQWSIPPLALGFLVAAAQQYEDGRLNGWYDFRPEWLTDPDAPISSGPAVYLYSQYVWSSTAMLEHAAQVKAANPSAVTVHGGPDVPKYEPDVERFFADHPQVDVTVRGEGEITTPEILDALGPALAGGEPVDLRCLDAVAGLSYRGVDGRPVRTADRERLTDLDIIPSPFLTGLFDSFGGTTPSVVIETNRGCPYGCTFCDWGSATASRIRKFDLDRVFAELEWCAQNEVRYLGIADANFGILERDVAIAERIAELRQQYGYPHHVGMNYAKNTVKHLKSIVDILVDAGILAMGLLSLQSMDEDTLSVIKRSNIKLEKYEDLAREFRANGLPLYVDLMMGLPGSTPAAFRNDLQECINREVHAKVHPTQVLVNSPMNEPTYRAEHGITAEPGKLLRSAASFTEDDYDEMSSLRRVFLLSEKFGVLRHVLRYARSQTGQGEVDLLADLVDAAQADPDRWPALKYTFDFIPSLMVPPIDWCWMLHDVRRWLIEERAIADDAALEAVLRAQHAMLPAPERRFPEVVDLPHDYVAWHDAVVACKEEGHLDDWPQRVPSLRSFGPGTLTVTDPHHICSEALGRHINSGVWSLWELDSDISRPSEGALVVTD